MTNGVLVDWQIRQEIESGRIKIDPFKIENLNPSSLDFRLGDKYTFVKTPKNIKTCGYVYGAIDPLDHNTFYSETIELDDYWLKPQESILVSMYERLRLPPNISGRVLGKSSLARLGLDNSSGAAWLDPGFEGYVTLELTNHSQFALKLSQGMRVGQIIFYKHDYVATSYSKTGRYHNQAAGQGSKGII